MSLDSWAIDKLSVFLGFDSETLKTQILPYLMSTDSPDAFAEQVMNLVGTSEEALTFIQEFTERRFQPTSERVAVTTPPSKPKQITSVQNNYSTPSSPIVPNTHLENAFPELPTNEQPYETMWPININVQKKEDEYFSGLKKNKRSKNRSENAASGSSSATTSELRAAAFPAAPKPTPPKKEKKKKNNEMTLEAALKELDIKAEKPGKQRKSCQCQATKHPLLTAAPNCLNCGKIVCTAEGVGPCTFCGSPVLSKEQQIALISEAKRKRTEQKQTQNQPPPKAASSVHGGMPAYASKLGGSTYTGFQNNSGDYESRLKAEEHKEKLLEFQRSSAQRSTIIDQATDFELPTDQNNPWLSPQEKALNLKKQQSNLKRIEKMGQSSRHKVMTIDIATKQVKVQDAELSSSSSEDEAETPKKINLDRSERKEEGGSAGTYAHNPLLKGITAPTFVRKQTKKTKGQLRRKERVQYDVDDVMNDYIYSGSIADDDSIEPVNEPITCQ